MPNSSYGILNLSQSGFWFSLFIFWGIPDFFSTCKLRIGPKYSIFVHSMSTNSHPRKESCRVFLLLSSLTSSLLGEAIVSAVTSGSKKFFLGTDSAPHERRRKECTCGCAGIYSAPIALSLYAKVFEEVFYFVSYYANNLFISSFSSKHHFLFLSFPFPLSRRVLSIN